METVRASKNLIIYLLIIIAVMAAAAFVRMPAAVFSEDPVKNELYTDDSGLPYLTDQDSYYHVRLVDNYLDHQMLGDTKAENGEEWDYHSFYPEGRNAHYHPAIVWLTALFHRISGRSTDEVEYSIAVIVSVSAALIASVIGFRAVGIPGGLAAGLITGCAPPFATRTCLGRFDTDMFIIPMELLLILCLTEALRAEDKRKRQLFAVLFALTELIYACCWSPRYSMMFAGLTLTGGFLFALSEALLVQRKTGSSLAETLKNSRVLLVLLTGALTFAGLALRSGLGIIPWIFSAFSFTNTTAVGENILPNLNESISELGSIPIFPREMKNFFTASAGSSSSVVNSVGGGAAAIFCTAGLLIYFGKCIYGLCKHNQTQETARRNERIYFCVFAAWFAACLFLMRFGMRFAEHLAIPAGLLAGYFVSEAAAYAGKVVQKQLQKQNEREQNKPQQNRQQKQQKALQQNQQQKPQQDRQQHRQEKSTRSSVSLIRAAFSLALILAAAVPSMTGARQAVSNRTPSATDSDAKAMDFIREYSAEDDAVVASWWDKGYFYEARSKHPCLWDGGSTDGIRAILVSKALIADDPELSRRILLMLSGSGNAAAEKLMEHTDAKQAFDTLWETLMLSREDTVKYLQDRLALDSQEAQETEDLIHPAAKETWLVLTFTMAKQIGWYEYYGNWDFTGTAPRPARTRFSYAPDGTPLFTTEDGQQYLTEVREKETMWRLFFNAEQMECFTPAFEWYDGSEHTRVWRVEPL